MAVMMAFEILMAFVAPHVADPASGRRKK